MQIKKLSLIVVLLKRLFRQEGAVPEFRYRDGQYPEQVNFLRVNETLCSSVQICCRWRRVCSGHQRARSVRVKTNHDEFGMQVLTLAFTVAPTIEYHPEAHAHASPDPITIHA